MSLGTRVVTLTLCTLVSCFRPSEERAILDQSVGIAAGAGIRVTVTDGLAAVQHLGAGTVTLWAQAPELVVDLAFDPSAAGALELSIDNCLADATLRVTTVSGVEVRSQRRPPVGRTSCRWHVAHQGEAALRLSLTSAYGAPEERWRFAMLSDVQGQFHLGRRVFQRINLDPTIRFVVAAGDFTESGTLPELRQWQSALRELHVPLYGTPGNHEVVEWSSEYATMFGRSSYRFVYRGVQYTFLDSSAASIDPIVVAQLRGWLAEGRDRVHIVVTHIPPIDPVGERNLGFSSRDEAARLLAMLARGGVDLTLYGHLHSYYAFVNAGIPAYASGGGGGAPEELVGLGLHYLAVDVNEQGVHGITRIDVR